MKNKVTGKYIKKIRRKLLGSTVGRRIRDNRIKSEKQLKAFRYKELKRYIDRLDSEEAIATMQQLFALNCKRIRKQNHARVAFVVYSSSEWQCERLYRLMEKDDFYSPDIIISGFRAGDTERVYKTTRKFFDSSKYKVKDVGYSDEDPGGYEELLDSYDILVYASPYDSALKPDYANAYQRKLNQLLIHIPYSVYIEDAPAKYSKTLITCAWMNICVTEYEKEYYKSFKMRGYNVHTCGYIKLDDYKAVKADAEKIWKKCREDSFKIILAPHFVNEKVGTFHKNYKWFYEYAKNHPETSWVLKPHPRMTKSDFFSSEEEYRKYLGAWDELPNASTRIMGSYYDLFATSDVMILDSMSFVAEYQITGKPLLFLTGKEHNGMNRLGQALMEHIYKADGEDFSTIESFITEIGRMDPMKEMRDEFRNKMFAVNIRSYASDRVMSVISEELKSK